MRQAPPALVPLRDDAGRFVKQPCRELPSWPVLSEKHVHVHHVGRNSNLPTPHPGGSPGRTEGSPIATLLPRPTLAVSAEGSQACAKGCELCSEVNGCLKCSPKLFILLERNDIRQVGVCLPSCPPGYFDARNPDMNKCISECVCACRGDGVAEKAVDTRGECFDPLVAARRVEGTLRMGDEASDSSIQLRARQARESIHLSTPLWP